MKFFTVTLLGLGVLFSANANSDESLTLGASIGYVNIKNDNSDFDFDANAQATSSTLIIRSAAILQSKAGTSISGHLKILLVVFLGRSMHLVGIFTVSATCLCPMTLMCSPRPVSLHGRRTRSSMVSSSTPTTVRISPWALAHAGTLVNHSASARRSISLISTKPTASGWHQLDLNSGSKRKLALHHEKRPSPQWTTLVARFDLPAPASC